MAVARTGKPGTWNSGDLLSAVDLNSLPGGTIGRDTLTADSSTGTTTSELVCSVSTDTGVDREVTISGVTNLRGSAATGAFAALFEDGVQLQRKNTFIPATATDTPLSLSILSYPTTGAHTYAMYTGVSGSTAGQRVTCSNNGYTGTRGVTQLRVVDTGPSF